MFKTSAKFVYNQFRERMLKTMKFLIMAQAPFKVSQLKSIRLEIMKTMKLKGFESHYVNQMKRLNQEIAKINDNNLSDDNYWSNNTPFWVRDTPWLYEKYRKNLKRITTRETGVASLTKLILNDKFVKSMFNQDWMNEQFRILLKSLLSTYYLTQPGTTDRLWPVHLNIDLAYRENAKPTQNPKDAIKQVIQSCFAGSGPFVLKILQQINIMAGTEVEIGDGQSLSELAEDIFKNVPPLTNDERELLYKTFHEDSNIRGKIGKLLGSASIAEAHLYTTPDSTTPNRVMKFIKPIYAYYFLCEVDFLLNVTWKAIRKWAHGNENHIRQTRQTLLYFIKEFSSEFDYRAEFEFTQMGLRDYEIPGKITSVIIHEAVYNPFPVFIMNKLEGASVDDLLHELTKAPKTEITCYSKNIQAVYKSCFELYQRWLSNALFGDGFFHADLHPGNLFIERHKCEINSASKTNSNNNCEVLCNKIHILDYGSSGILTKTQQCRLLKTMIIPQRLKEVEFLPETKSKNVPYVITANSRNHWHNIKIVKQFIRSVNKICDITTMTPKQVKAMAPHLLNYQKDEYGLANTFNQLFTRYMEFAPNIGSCSNNSLILFGRGLTYLDNLMYRLAQLCNNSSKCPEFPVGEAITPLITNHLGKSIKCAGGINLISAALNRG